MAIHCSMNAKKWEVMRGVRKTSSLLPPGEEVSPGTMAQPRARGDSFFRETR